MATLIELEQNGDIERIDVALDVGEQPWRTLYGTPAFIEWLDNVLPDLQTTVVGGDTTPMEQVDAVFYEYVVGEPLNPDRRFKRLNWTPDLYVWEFKTPDIRILGWIPARDVFICTYGEMKDRLEALNLYGRYQALTNFARDNLDLNEPKAILSRNYTDVVSDAD
ncbi:hypothetical protein [Sinorhizobium fredii]|uniref:hypothetical protein n=1 Tax=Rhizobium fredii TaxID=380 RepID=UPI0006848914|nr:hypothetical protein [Sinorhizobium fredii]